MKVSFKCSEDDFHCRPSARQQTQQKEPWGSWKLDFTETGLPLNCWCVYVSVCVYTVLTVDPRNQQSFDAAPGQPAPHWRPPGRSGPSPHAQVGALTRDTGRQRKSPFTGGWEQRQISLRHLGPLLSAGVWCAGEDGLLETLACYGAPSPCLKSLLGRGLSYLQKEMKTAALTVIGTLFGWLINGWSSSPSAHTLFINPPASPGLLKHCFAGTFFFFFFNPQAWNFL